MATKKKKVRLETPQSLIELFKELSSPTRYPKHETNKVNIRSSCSKEDCISLIKDYELMKRRLKKCGYKIDSLWAIGLDGTVTRTERGEELYMKKVLAERKAKRKKLKKIKRKRLR